MSESAPNRPVILLVDDNPHDVVLIRLAFRKVGIIDTIQLVKNGGDAMRYIKGEGPYRDRSQFPPPTLVLLDLKMPQTSGFDVLNWIRNQPELESLVVVVMSGSRNDSDIEKAYTLGANSYLVKPTRFEDLVKMMESLKDSCGPRKRGSRVMATAEHLPGVRPLTTASMVPAGA
ncbi:MAG TPA: response regulator [Methylomirabilota bacterium]|nr:response regulator [Methylomirabilota bacterium]